VGGDERVGRGAAWAGAGLVAVGGPAGTWGVTGDVTTPWAGGCGNVGARQHKPGFGTSPPPKLALGQLGEYMWAPTYPGGPKTQGYTRDAEGIRNRREIQTPVAERTGWGGGRRPPNPRGEASTDWIKVLD